MKNSLMYLSDKILLRNPSIIEPVNDKLKIFVRLSILDTKALITSYLISWQILLLIDSHQKQHL